MAKMTSLANATGNFPTGRDYPQQTVSNYPSNVVHGVSFDTAPNAPTVSYEEMQRKEREDRERREAEERESRRMTDFAVNVALMGACMGGCG